MAPAKDQPEEVEEDRGFEETKKRKPQAIKKYGLRLTAHA
jgi:hypothetical protein